MVMTEEERQAWRAIRKELGLTVDPKTAEVMWTYAQTLDPYGIYPEVREECDQIGREYFARPSGSDVWVSFDDLPEPTIRALRQELKERQACPEPRVYRRSTELKIEGEDPSEVVFVRIEQATKLIEKICAALREIEAAS
jgi:hypothetical protein